MVQGGDFVNVSTCSIENILGYQTYNVLLTFAYINNSEKQ